MICSLQNNKIVLSQLGYFMRGNALLTVMLHAMKLKNKSCFCLCRAFDCCNFGNKSCYFYYMSAILKKEELRLTKGTLSCMNCNNLSQLGLFPRDHLLGLQGWAVKVHGLI